MDPELHENRGKIILDAIRRLYRRNSRVTLYKLIQKTHPADMAWIFRYLSPTERRDIFQYIRRMEGLSAFLKEIDHALVPDIFEELSSLESCSHAPLKTVLVWVVVLPGLKYGVSCSLKIPYVFVAEGI